jgi:hypothetical protein
MSLRLSFCLRARGTRGGRARSAHRGAISRRRRRSRATALGRPQGRRFGGLTDGCQLVVLSPASHRTMPTISGSGSVTHRRAQRERSVAVHVLDDQAVPPSPERLGRAQDSCAQLRWPHRRATGAASSPTRRTPLMSRPRRALARARPIVSTDPRRQEAPRAHRSASRRLHRDIRSHRNRTLAVLWRHETRYSKVVAPRSAMPPGTPWCPESRDGAR